MSIHFDSITTPPSLVMCVAGALVFRRGLKDRSFNVLDFACYTYASFCIVIVLAIRTLSVYARLNQQFAQSGAGDPGRFARDLSDFLWNQHPALLALLLISSLALIHVMVARLSRRGT